MISSISSMSSSMSMMQSNSVQRQGPPPGQDVFKMVDTDSDGSVSSTELESLVSALSEVTGESMNAGDSMASYDSNGDGALSGEELLGLMSSQGFAPPMMVESESGDMQEMQPPPPPPPSSETVQSAYGQNSGSDMLSQLLEILQSGTDSSESYASISVTG